MEDNNFCSEYKHLRDFSAQIGVDPWQVQGAGGNTSLKSEKLMWIKASGTWLANAADSELFVPVELEPLLLALRNGNQRAEKSVDFVNEELNPQRLRPSIETTVHAILPQKVVVHVHCVDTIALAVQTQGQKILDQILYEYQWLWVPYARPGLPLSRYIAANLKPGTNVIVLGNHGLVVAADTVEEASRLLQRVRNTVSQHVKSVPSPQLDALQAMCKNTEYAPAANTETHAVALNEHSLGIAAGGSMYPDHVIFLGEGSVVLDNIGQFDEVVNQYLTEHGTQPISIIVSGLGVVMHKASNASQHAMARCLSDVCLRIATDSSIRYLSAEDHDQLLNWEAETFRQSTAK